jgi:hypothetical protein
LRDILCVAAYGGAITGVTGNTRSSSTPISIGQPMCDHDDLDHWEAEFDRRLVGRTRIDKGALLFFKGQPGSRGCNVTNVTNHGAGVRTHDLPMLPTTFDLTFDNFRTIRRCRLIWREGDSLGLAFEN